MYHLPGIVQTRYQLSIKLLAKRKMNSVIKFVCLLLNLSKKIALSDVSLMAKPLTGIIRYCFTRTVFLSSCLYCFGTILPLAAADIR